MKQFLKSLYVALFIVVIVITVIFAVNVSASEITEYSNVIFISDNAKPGGDGSSAESPLYPEEVSDAELDILEINQKRSDGTAVKTKVQNNYKKTALYQAIEKLSKTGGTVVVCGNVTIGNEQCRGTSYENIAEYYTPFNEKAVVITSKYKGVDYGKNASLILTDYTHLILNGPTVWENMNMVYAPARGDRVICCRGYKTVFGEGLNCKLAPSVEDKAANYYSIAGGERYANMTGDTDVTVKSGTFYKVLGGSWSAGTNTHTGSTNVRIEGGKIYTMISGNSNNTNDKSYHSGNANIVITGGTIAAGVYATGKGGFAEEGHKAVIKITGGDFNNGREAPITEYVSTYTGAGGGVLPSEFTVDLSEADGISNSMLNKMITALPEGTKVIYPVKWAVSANAKNLPQATFVFSGDIPDMEGVSVDVSFKNPITGTTVVQTVEYTKNSVGFNVDCDTGSEGNKIASYKYGSVEFYKNSIKVVNAPEVDIKGVQLKTGTTAQKMRFVASYTNVVSEGVSILDCGIISIASDMLVDVEYFNHINSKEMFDDVCTNEDVSGAIGDNIFFTKEALNSMEIQENNYARDYTARAYVKMSYDGKIYYRYSDPIERNLYNIANAIMEENRETTSVKDYINANVLGVYNNYDTSKIYDSNRASAARSKVVKYMESMRDIKWTPEETFIIYNEGGNGSTRMFGIFYKGKEYNGIPYINYNMTQTESFIDMMKGSYIPIDNPNISIKSNSDWSKLTAAQKAVGLENANNFPGNDCVGALIMAWNSVLTNRPEIKEMRYTSSIIPGHGNGVIAVGNYDYTNDFDNNTDEMVAANGEQVMAEAYAKLLPGDGTIYVRSNDEGNPRHARLVVKSPVVKRKTDGTIDVEKSYVTCMDQAAGANARFIVGTNLTSIHTKDYYFSALIKEGSLPITIPELTTGNMENEFTYVTKLNLEKDLPRGELNGIIKTNRQIISVRAVYSQNGVSVGEIKDTIVMRGANYHTASYELSGLDLSGIELKSGESYTFDLYTCVSGIEGREIHLVRGMEFTAE